MRELVVDQRKPVTINGVAVDLQVPSISNTNNITLSYTPKWWSWTPIHKFTFWSYWKDLACLRGLYKLYKWAAQSILTRYMSAGIVTALLMTIRACREWSTQPSLSQALQFILIHPHGICIRKMRGDANVLSTSNTKIRFTTHSSAWSCPVVTSCFMYVHNRSHCSLRAPTEGTFILDIIA